MVNYYLGIPGTRLYLVEIVHKSKGIHDTRQGIQSYGESGKEYILGNGEI